MIELDRKLRQMHAALLSVASEDMSSVQPRIVATDKHVFVSLDFNENSDEIALHNAASLLIANLASLKDYLKVWCKRTGYPFKGDALINSNRAAALIHDLWNTDRHAELSSPPRSGHRPKLGKVQTAMRLSTGVSAGSGAMFTMDPRTGKIMTQTSGGGKVQIVLDTQILDEHNNVIADFAQTCEDSVKAWSTELVAAGVSVP